MNSTTVTAGIALEFVKRGGDLNLDEHCDITAEALQILGQFGGWVLQLNGLQSLTSRDAEQLSSHQGALFLNGLRHLNPGPAAHLRRRTGTLALNGLQNVSVETSEQLGLHSGNPLELNGLPRLSKMAAEFLARHHGALELNGLLRISDDVATALKTHQGSLSLAGLTGLTEAAAESLAQHQGPLDLNGVTCLSDQAAASLSRCSFRLTLNRLTNVSPDPTTEDHPGYFALAKFLSPGEDMDVSCLAKTSDCDAIKLSQYANGSVNLNGLHGLSETAAAHLKNHIGTLHLNGLTEISEAVARQLGKYCGYAMYLNGLSDVPDSVAASLLAYDGKLSLDWSNLTKLTENIMALKFKHDPTPHTGGYNGRFTEMTEGAARFFIEKTREQPFLFLDSLETLSETAASHLATADARWLSLNGLQQISIPVAQALSRFQGDLALTGLHTVSVEVANKFEGHKGGLLLGRIENLSDAAAKSLKRHVGNLEMSDDSALPDQVRAILAS